MQNNTPQKNDTDSRLTLKRKRIIAIVSIVITVALFLAAGIFVTKRIFGGMGIAEFKELIDSYGSMGVLVAFAIQVLQVIVSPIPGEVVEVAMGFCFGWFGGMLLCVLGSAVGASIIFPLTKKYGIKIVELFVSIDRINELRFINSEKKLHRFVFLLYFIPGTPKDPLIFFFGLTRIKLSTFLILSSFARIPSIVSSTLGGKFIVDKNYFGAILLFVITGVLSLAGMIAYQKILSALKKHHRKKHLAESDDKES